MGETVSASPAYPPVLTIWKSQLPREISKSETVLANALRTASADLIPAHLVSKACRPQSNPAEVQAVFPHLCTLPEDLMGSWLALGAARGSDLAALLLVTAVLRAVSRGEKADPRVAHAWATGLVLDPADILDKAANTARALAQASLPARPVKRKPDPDPDDDLLDIDDLLGLDKAATALPTMRSVVVCNGFGDPGSSEGKRVVRLYEDITRPLPLKSVALPPEMLRTVLLAEFPWMIDLVDALVGDCRLLRRAGTGHLRFRPTLLQGGPGCGKSRVVGRLGHLLGLGFSEIPAAGADDVRALRGTARGWSSTQPSAVVQAMLRAGCANPLINVDELEKAGHHHGASIKEALLPLLEPETARRWFDECLMAEVDCAHVSWFATANDMSRLPDPLLSRLRVIHIPPPGPEHFDALLRGICHDMAASLQVRPADLPELPGRVLAELRLGFARTGDIRRLKRAVEAALAIGADADLPSCH